MGDRLHSSSTPVSTVVLHILPLKMLGHLSSEQWNISPANHLLILHLHRAMLMQNPMTLWARISQAPLKSATGKSDSLPKKVNFNTSIWNNQKQLPWHFQSTHQQEPMHSKQTKPSAEPSACRSYTYLHIYLACVCLPLKNTSELPPGKKTCLTHANYQFKEWLKDLLPK